VDNPINTPLTFLTSSFLQFWAKSFFKTALETNSHEEAFVVLTLASKELVLSPMLSEMYVFACFMERRYYCPALL
jgi:hypothetical protein